VSRTATFALRCDVCPNAVKVEITDPTFQTKGGEYATAIAERIGWTLKDGKIRCVVHKEHV